MYHLAHTVRDTYILSCVFKSCQEYLGQDGIASLHTYAVGNIIDVEKKIQWKQRNIYYSQRGGIILADLLT